MNDEQIEEAALKSAENFGAAQDIFHPDYGWILREGKPTKEGLKWYTEQVLKEESE